MNSTAQKRPSDRKQSPFLKNEAGELLKTKENGQKRTENEAKAKQVKLLKVNDRAKKWHKNEPKSDQKANRKMPSLFPARVALRPPGF